MRRRFPAIAAAAFAILTPGAAISPALAQDKPAFLSAYAGEWRGAGEIRPNPRSDLTRITCRVSATFDAAKAALTNKGRCGTTQGSRRLNGTLRAEGTKLTGDFLGQAAAEGLMNPRAKIDRNMIVSEAEVQDGATVRRVRTFLTRPVDDAFKVQSQFYDRTSQSWVVSGEIKFQRQQ